MSIDIFKPRIFLHYNLEDVSDFEFLGIYDKILK